MSPQIGRPKSSNPKNIEVKARIDAVTDKKLQKYCKDNNISRTEVVRQGIELVLNTQK